MNLFDTKDYEALKKRIESLSADSERQWGSLSHEQMLAHCTKVLKVATTSYKKQYFLGKLFGKTIVKYFG